MINSTHNDARLLREARDDADAFAAFYEMYAEPVYLWALRRTGDVHVATDVTAESFARALEGVRRFRGLEPGSGVAWLFGIASNVLRGYHRKNRVETDTRERFGIATPSWVPDEIAEADSRLDAEMLADRIDAAVADLPEGLRDVVRLHAIEDLSHQEISAQLGITEPNVRMRLSRGLRRLKTTLATSKESA